MPNRARAGAGESDMSMKVLGAALAAAMLVTPAAAATVTVDRQPDIVDVYTGGVPYFTSYYYFDLQGLTLNAGDNFLLKTSLSSPVVSPYYNTLAPFVLLAVFNITSNRGCDVWTTCDITGDDLTHSGNSFVVPLSVDVTFSPLTILGFSAGFSFDGPVGSAVTINYAQAYATALPELSTWGLLTFGLAALGWKLRRQSFESAKGNRSPPTQCL